jgi:hypothetical protein
MPERSRAPPPLDYATLAGFLTALGYAPRLELLDVLRFPHTLGDIRLSPQRGRGGADRPAARQTIQQHLDMLAKVDLVRVEQVEKNGRMVRRYSVNPQKLYALTEDMRRLSTMHAGRGGAGDVTGTLSASAAPEEVQGPRLVLVHGVYEGKAFPLDAKTAPDGRWVVGRKPGLPVSLDYDLYVSLENSLLVRDGARFAVQDLPGSKNGTSVNWRALPRGGTRALRGGDVIGVGRSLLLFLES